MTKELGIQINLESQKKIAALEQNNLLHILPNTMRIEGKIQIPIQEGYLFLKADEIHYVEADNVYSNFYLNNGNKIVSSKNIGYYEAHLKMLNFMRIHHSHMINLNKMYKFIRGNDCYVILENNKILRVSRTYKDELLEVFRNTPFIPTKPEKIYNNSK